MAVTVTGIASLNIKETITTSVGSGAVEAIVGDLAHGRTARSLCYLLGKFSKIKILFIAPSHLKIGGDIKEYLDKHEVVYEQHEELDAHLPEIDILYLTRIQRERMSPAAYEKARHAYSITEDNLKLLRKDARLLHPLPHVEEISLSFMTEQNDPRVAYFRQAENGLYIR
ncbi:MAG: hypothetical protein IIC21_11650, partial [Chloroflexi bacterium]|nr:hypothetical protein [Chloroflexota bacterium]